MTTVGALPATNGLSADGYTEYTAESPATPVNNDVDVKIDIDQFAAESDARHEPVQPAKAPSVTSASVQPEVGTPVHPDTIPIHPPTGATPPPPTGQLLPEVEMAERAEPKTEESVMDDTEPTPVPLPPMTPEVPSTAPSEGSAMDVEPAVNGHSSPKHESQPDASPKRDPEVEAVASQTSLRRSASEMDDDEHPAKRARMTSDADQEMRQTSTPPITNGHTEHPPALPMNPIQHRFCLSVVRSLKKMKDSVPFVRPVDPVALNIPHYPSIIKNPMDLSTVERKLGSSNPAKPDPNPSNPRYRNVDEFIADVRLIFSNALLFNGPDHAVTLMGKRVQDVFDKQLRQMPPADEPKLIAKPKSPTPPPPAVTKKPARRSSTTLPVIRRNEAETVSTRPKREIHPPPPKDLPYAEPPKKAMRKVRRTKDPSTMAQLQFCSKLLADLHKKQHYAIASPFYDPVDWVALNIPDYPKIVKKPMDMSTMRKKLDNHEYPNAQKFYDDFKLMIRNCFSFNPAGTPVNQAGIDLQRLFDDKWKSLPRRQETQDESELEDEEEDETDDERARQIAAMESQIEAMRNNLAAIKNGAVAGPKPKEKKKKEKREKYAPAAPVASTSKASKPKASAPAGGKKKSGGGGSKKTAAIADDDVLSFEQKKELSEAIGALDGTKLERVIQIIHEGVPEIRDSTEEIELEIDTLPAAVLTKLYNFVIRPLKAGPKRSRVPKGGGTGGLKRKSMDEDVEAEKIRQLEERMRLFEQGAEAPMPALPGIGHDSDASSDSSSDESSDSE